MPGLDPHALVEGTADAVDGAAPVGEQGRLGKGGEALAECHRLIQVLAGWHDLGDETDPLGFVGIHDPSGEDEVQGAAQADDSGQPLGSTVDEGHTPAPLEKAEPGTGGADPQVAPEREFQAPRYAPAFYRGSSADRYCGT